MRKDIKFENSGEIRDFKEYSENKLAVAKVCVLSTAPNSHQLNISEEVLRRDIGSIRGNFLVAHMFAGDATTHTPSEVPVGYFLPDEPIEFEEVEQDGKKIIKAWAYAVLSKQYAKSAYDMFVADNHRATSIEMAVVVSDEDEHEVVSFDAYGSTILGKTVLPSCKDAEISLVRFAEEASVFYGEHKDKLSELKRFVKEREQMAEKKTYKIDKSKEAMSDADWSNVDKSALRDKIMGAENRFALVKATYMLIENGWEDAPSEKLKYPVMAFDSDTLVYYHRALSSALAYARQNNETAVVNKIEKIYKKLDLDDNEGEKEEKMAEVEFSAVNVGDLWGRVYAVIREHDAWDYGIQGIYEEDNQKFAILIDCDQKLYRLNFSLTEEGMTASDELVEVKQEFTETDNIKRFAEPENVEQYRKFAEPEDVEMSADEMKAKIAELQAEIENRDNIIMEKDEAIKTKDVELADLRAFKQTCMEAERGAKVDTVMSEVAKFMDKTQVEEYRKEGLTCEFAEVDAWANKVKASVFDKATKQSDNGEFTRMSAPLEIKKTGSVWERL